jgi:hypothetical protein
MSEEEAHQVHIQSEEIKTLVHTIYTQKKTDQTEEQGKEFSQVVKDMAEEKPDEWSSDDTGQDEIARVVVNADTMSDIDRYMKEHDLDNFSETVHQLIRKGLEAP